MNDPASVFYQATETNRSGVDTLQALTHAGLSIVDGQGVRVAQLAEAVPTVENGLWKVFSDGRMETTWRIKSGALWHDGTPVTTDDLLFTAALARDHDLPRFADTDFQYVEAVEASDSRTVTVQWAKPFIGADGMFAAGFAYPLPKHLLETAHRDSKPGFMDLRYWSDEYVGAGPFRVDQWERGRHILLAAFNQYVLGRPKIDLLEVRLIPDGNALVASLLSGVIDLTLGRSISVEQAVQVTAQWQDGRVVITPQNLVRLYWQFLNPTPRAILDVRFRRALLTAIDREEMAEAFQGGMAPASYSYLYPGQAQYQQLEAGLPRYDYNPARAAAELENLGYSKGPDGILHDAFGRPLALDLLVSTGGGDTNVRSTFAVADYWKRIAIDANVAILTDQLGGSERLKYEATWPGFTLTRSFNDAEGISSLHSTQARLPEKGYNGQNKGNYLNAELDSLIDRYFATIPAQERVRILGQIAQHISDQLTVFPLFYGAEPSVVSNRLSNVGPRPNGPSIQQYSQTQAWNAHEWDVRA